MKNINENNLFAGTEKILEKRTEEEIKKALFKDTYIPPMSIELYNTRRKKRTFRTSEEVCNEIVEYVTRMKKTPEFENEYSDDIFIEGMNRKDIKTNGYEIMKFILDIDETLQESFDDYVAVLGLYKFVRRIYRNGHLTDKQYKYALENI